MEVSAPELKVCRDCLEAFPLTEFHVDRYNADGLKTRCRASRGTSYVVPNLDHARKLGRDQQRRRRLQGFGLSAEDFDAMRDLQGGVCAICSLVPDKWAIDHHHETGEVRGLLCMNCNSAIGFLRDNPEIVDAAAAYLRLRGHTS